MNEDVYTLSQEEGKAELLKLFREFGLENVTLTFKDMTWHNPDGTITEEIGGSIEFHEPNEDSKWGGLEKQEYVDFVKADRLEKLVLEFGETYI